MAALLLEKLGDHHTSWDRFRTSALRLTPSTPKTLGALIQEAAAPTP
ncbi:hypothetical protein ACH4M4_33470 [Streptomyces sp. NPDC017254]